MSGKQGVQTNPANAEVHSMDPVWQAVCREAEAIVDSEPLLGTFIYSTILNQSGLEAAVAHRIAERLHNREVSGDIIRRSFEEMHQSDPDWGEVLRSDIAAVCDRDPACVGMDSA